MRIFFELLKDAANGTFQPAIDPTGTSNNAAFSSRRSQASLRLIATECHNGAGLAARRVQSAAGAGLALPIDPGSISVNRFENIEKRLPGRFYLNSDTHIRRGPEFSAIREHVPTFAIYEPGFIRLGAALTSVTPGVKTPVLSLHVHGSTCLGLSRRVRA
jgi:hypothetical protein